MMRPDAKVKNVYLYPKAVDVRKFVGGGVAALVELEIKVAVFGPELFAFLNKPRRNQGLELQKDHKKQHLVRLFRPQ